MRRVLPGPLLDLEGDLMSAIPRPKVRPYVWDRGRAREVEGVAVRSGTAVAFIPDRDLRRIADALHDRADQLEQEAES